MPLTRVSILSVVLSMLGAGVALGVERGPVKSPAAAEAPAPAAEPEGGMADAADTPSGLAEGGQAEPDPTSNAGDDPSPTASQETGRGLLDEIRYRFQRMVPADADCRQQAATIPGAETLPTWALELRACLVVFPTLYDRWQCKPSTRSAAPQPRWYGEVSDDAVLDWLQRSFEAHVPASFACRAGGDWTSQMQTCLGMLSIVQTPRFCAENELAPERRREGDTEETARAEPDARSNGSTSPAAAADAELRHALSQRETELAEATTEISRQSEIIIAQEADLAALHRRLAELGVQPEATFAFLHGDAFASGMRRQDIPDVEGLDGLVRYVRADECEDVLDWLFSQPERAYPRVWVLNDHEVLVCERSNIGGAFEVRPQDNPTGEAHVVVFR